MFCRVECFISGLSGNFRAVVNAITRLIAFLSSEYISSLVPTLVLFCYCVFLTLKWWRDDDEDEVFPLRRKGFTRWHLVAAMTSSDCCCCCCCIYSCHYRKWWDWSPHSDRTSQGCPWRPFAQIIDEKMARSLEANRTEPETYTRRPIDTAATSLLVYSCVLTTSIFIGVITYEQPQFYAKVLLGSIALHWVLDRWLTDKTDQTADFRDTEVSSN